MTHTRWRRQLLVRDSRPVLPRPDSPRMGICVLCGDQIFYRGYQLQAHHIYPKSLYKERQFDLKNGVMLCASHHALIHNNNPGVDVRNSSTTAGWRQYVVLFRRWVNLKRK